MEAMVHKLMILQNFRRRISTSGTPPNCDSRVQLEQSREIDEEFRLRFDQTDAETVVLQRLQWWKPNGQFVVDAQGLNRWFVNAGPASGPYCQLKGSKPDRTPICCGHEYSQMLSIGEFPI